MGSIYTVSYPLLPIAIYRMSQITQSKYNDTPQLVNYYIYSNIRIVIFQPEYVLLDARDILYW